MLTSDQDVALRSRKVFLGNTRSGLLTCQYLETSEPPLGRGCAGGDRSSAQAQARGDKGRRRSGFTASRSTLSAVRASGLEDGLSFSEKH